MNFLVNQVLESLNSNLRDRDMSAQIDMQLSTESLDLLVKSSYQTEVSFNQLLPYADKLEDEADLLLTEIKGNFGRCVMLRDIKPGCVYWSQILTKYIVLYGLRFSKDDHIAFIKLVYELLTIPNLPPSLIDTFGKTLHSLLKKKETISPDELELQWEPLYKLCDKVNADKSTQFTLYLYPEGLENTLENLVKAAKIYFPPSATREILDELRPKLCPFDTNTMCSALKLLRWFLPVQLAVEHHGIGHELWLHEFMELWEVCYNVHVGEKDFMRLMAQLASNNIGYIDWNPYIPVMFTRFVHSLNLPVNYASTVAKKNHRMEIIFAGEWIASVLGDNSNAQMYLEKFLKTIETYVHPANFGPWLQQLVCLIAKTISSVVLRLHKERNAKETWELPIPESHKLTEANIDAFVNAFMPVVTTAVFNKNCSQNISFALQHLAMMRPNLIIPNLIEKLYPSLGDLEPHKFITAMSCMVAISRPLVQSLRSPSEDCAIPRGALNVLLFSSLQGIDPNDPFKCFGTFKLIAALANLIPIVDCSKSRAKVSEEERAMLEETSQFEDFMLQLMDKVFILIESSSMESVRLENQSNDGPRNVLESMAESALHKVFYSLLLQTSEPIFISALNKLRGYIAENTFETKIAGQMVALLCKAFTQVNSQVALRVLVPFLAEGILNAIDEGEEVLQEENLDNQLLYSLLLLKRVVETQGDALLPYMDILLKVIDKAILLKSLEGNQLGCQLLSNVLGALCTVQAIKVDKNLDDLEYPYWKDWGESVDIKSAEIKWYVPGEQEIAAAQNIFARYFLPAVNSVQNYINTKNSLTRDELLTTLRIIDSVIEGCDSVLPIWSEPPLIDKPFELCITTFKPITGTGEEIKMPDGSNVRRFLVKILTDLQDIMLENVEDDTKSLIKLTEIWVNLSMNKFRESSTFNTRRNFFSLTKKNMENKIVGDKGYLPRFLLERVSIQHGLRQIHATHAFTQTSKDIILNLFKLSISQYSRIRIRAQVILWEILKDFPNAYKIIIPHVIEVLGRDTETHHDAYKGVLYLIHNNVTFGVQNSLLDKEDWQVLSSLLPALVMSTPSEKPSVINRQDYIIDKMNKLVTTNIILQVPDSCVSTASKFWSTGVQPNISQPTKKEINKGVETLRKSGDDNLNEYNAILDKLMHAIMEKNLHWRHRKMATHFISALVHPDHNLPAPVVRYFLNALIHDSIDERKLAWSMTMYALKQLKRKHPKITLDIKNRENDLNPGRRADNDWLQYNLEKRPLSTKEWDEPRYLHKQYLGYYTWPKKVEIYAPSNQQPTFDKKKRHLSSQEKEVDTFFSDVQNVNKFVKFLTLEEKKGTDKFNLYRYLLFKGLFRNHGDAHLGNFLPQLDEMVRSKQESVQRCAAELVCGLIRGSKHWTYSMTENMWKSLLPIVKLALSNLTEETIADWYNCFSLANKNRDPNRLHWLIDCLAEESELAKSEASFIEFARLFILQGALTPQSWRLCELHKRLVARLEKRLLENPFKNVRDQLASILVSIFDANLKFPRQEGNKGYPEAEDFVLKFHPRLEVIMTEVDNKSAAYIESSRLLNTVCQWIHESVCDSYVGVHPSFYKLYPIISQIENSETDKELSANCNKTLAVLATAFTLPQHIPAALEALDNVSKSSSWSARAGCAKFLQVLLLHNMSTFLSNDQWISAVRTIVLRLLRDDRVEVRERSAQVLNGMLHCTLVTEEQSLLEEFQKIAKTKLRSKKSSDNPDSIKAIRLRHVGVLGMCAYIQAHPYDIPKDVPLIFEHLSSHLNDPEPIPTTIRKTLNDFKRTHCDGWTGLQGLAQDLTEEQFSLLQDLTMPASYYA